MGTIHKSCPIFGDLSWVLRARADSYCTSQEALKTLCVSDSEAVCTDGHRMHIIKNLETTPVTPGLWTVNAMTKQYIILEPSRIDTSRYPDYRKLLEYGFSEDAHVTEASGRDRIIRAAFRLAEASFDVYFLLAAIWDNDATATLRQKDKLSPLYIYDNEHTAAVCPLFERR